MHKTTLAILSASAIALAGCGPKPGTDNAADTNLTAMNDTAAMTTDNPVASATPVGGQSFADAAAASDAFEIATSKLALANSQSAAVKSFANQMIAAHTASTAKLKATTSALAPAITPNPMLNAEQQAKVDAMKPLKGSAFDKAYVTGQRADHQQTLDVLRGYAATGDVAQLKTFAAGLAPTVAAHLNMANGLKI